MAAENWAAKAQAATSALKAREAEMAAQASAIAKARESPQDAAEQATIATQLALKEAIDAAADRDAQLMAVRRELAHERHARAFHDSAAAPAAPSTEVTAERHDEQNDGDSENERGGDEDGADANSDPEADDDQVEACRLVDSVLSEQLAAVEDDALRLHRLEHGLDESGDVGLDEVDTSSPLRALAGLGAKSRGLGSHQLARLGERLDKAVVAASTSTMTSPTLGCVLTAPGGNFAPAPGTGGAFMGPSSGTHPTPTTCEPDLRPAQHEHTARPPAFRREAQQTPTPTRAGPRFGGVSADTTPGPRFGGAVATAMSSALRTAVSRVGDVAAPRASPQSSDGSYENISQSPFVASGPPRSREAPEHLEAQLERHARTAHCPVHRPVTCQSTRRLDASRLICLSTRSNRIREQHSRMSRGQWAASVVSRSVVPGMRSTVRC